MFDDEAVVRAYVPPGWPASVRPPGAEGWERTAVAFLLDCCPPEYRGYPLLLKQPQVLARFAREFVEGQLAATRSNLAGARTSLGGLLSVQTMEATIAVLHSEEARLIRVRRAAQLLEAALWDVRFKRKL
ncbi:MAG: hypothetical protein Q4D79_11730 [Propionibacteriaceae bacterium]|nr:hypothetical protein [Propionibacteriaceae bacterium]